jgi:hypothetical protein
MFGLDVQSIQVGKGGARYFFLVFRISELLTTFFHSFVMLCTNNRMVGGGIGDCCSWMQGVVLLMTLSTMGWVESLRS